MTVESEPISAIASARCLSLTTFKRDGTPVATPIWFNIIGDKIVVTTPRSSWKVKRVQNNPKVCFAVCTLRGRVTGSMFEGVARVLADEEIAPVLKVKRRRYFPARFIQMLPSARDQVAIEITPGGPTEA
ncbi:MAG: PPOX class F420-dependent oxidoreductase [Acidimicrobiia bacterium]